MKENWEDHWKDYYQILQVHLCAEQEIITAAYRKLADKYHPDHNPGKEAWANEKFKGINEAEKWESMIALFKKDLDQNQSHSFTELSSL